MKSLRSDPFAGFWVGALPGADAARATAPARSDDSTAGLRDLGRHDGLLRVILWPLAVLLVVHTVFVRAVAGSVTDDFTTVYLAARRFLDRVPVYDEIYHHVDPHYLYNPGATLLLSPLGISHHPNAVRMVFILVGAAAIIAALAWLTRLFGYRASSAVLPLAVCAAFLTEAVRNTLVFANINGVLLLVFVAFIAWLLRGRDWAAGVALGLCILVKPMFAPLIVLCIAVWCWRAVITAVAVPVVANLVAWPLVPGAGDYLTKLAPYLGEVRDYANSSLPGIAVYFGWPDWLRLTLTAVCAAAVAVAVIVLARYRFTAPLMWLTTSSSVLLAGVFLLSSLGQQYYSMMLFPLVFTVLLDRSVVHNWPAWATLAAVFSPFDWDAEAWGQWGRWVGQFANTAGWTTLLVVAAAVAVAWWRSERAHAAGDRAAGTVADTDGAEAAGDTGGAREYRARRVRFSEKQGK
ncbi:glycosyltransferase family 87 protein [Corynebacterium frankenforstense]